MKSVSPAAPSAPEISEESKAKPLTEEQLRLDKMRSDKFKFILDAMANHAIEEQNSEYSASFLSDGHGNVVHGAGRHRAVHVGEFNNSTVLEVDEMSESSKQS